MAVIFAPTATSLSTASGFKRTLSDNLGCFNATTSGFACNNLAIPFTPSAGEQVTGVVLCIWGGTAAYASLKNNLTVTLQENVASVWTSRATVTYTRTQIKNNTTFNLLNPTFVYFTGGTFPYTVTAVGSTWRLLITSAAGGGGTADYFVKTSDGVNPFYVVVGSTNVSYTDNTDQIVSYGDVTLDQNFTFKGKLGTGDTTRSVCGIACSNGTVNAETVSGFKWKFNSAQYTGNLDGLLVIGAQGAFKVGELLKFTSNVLTGATSATLSSAWGYTTGTYQATFLLTGQTRTVTLTNGATTCTWTDALTADEDGYAGVGQPSANVGTLNILSATSGTNINSGFSGYFGASSNNTGNSSYMIFGEYPAVEDETIASDVAVGASSLTTVNATGWVNGDKIYIGGQNVKGSAEHTDYTVTSTSGTTVNFSPNIASYIRKANGKIFRFNGYGFKIYAPVVSTGITNYLTVPNHLFIVGVEFRNLSLQLASNNATVFTGSDPEHTNQYFGHCSSKNDSTLSALQYIFVGGPVQKGTVIDNVNTLLIAITQMTYQNPVLNLTVKNCIPVPSSRGTASVVTGGTHPISIIDNNNFENNSGSSIISNHINSRITNNRFWGCGTTIGAIRAGGVINTYINNNSYQNNTSTFVFYQGCTALNSPEYNAKYGTEVANTVDIGFNDGCFVQHEIVSPQGNLTIGAGTSFKISSASDGSILRVSNYNSVTNDDRCYLTNGNYLRTGTGQSDTTCRTAGGYALRIQPTSSTILVNYPNTNFERYVPIGNCQNKVVTLTMWVNINNSAFYAGTHQKPRLYVKYDNATTTYVEATATTGWQLLTLSITPTTTFGQIEMWVSARTDATGSNAYFYLDDASVQFPAGSTLNLGLMDLWASATPVWPPISTTISAADVWAADPTQFGANTVGDKVNNIKNDTGIIPALL